MTTATVRETHPGKLPRSTSWRYKTAAHISLWFTVFFALAVTVFLASTGGVNATAYNWPAIVIAALGLAVTGGLATASVLTRNAATA